jgi:hypothetical protein
VCLLLLARLLELTGAKEPAALEKLVKAVGVKPASVNKDLLLYKGVLSKLSSAKVRRGQGRQGRALWPHVGRACVAWWEGWGAVATIRRAQQVALLRYGGQDR